MLGRLIQTAASYGRGSNTLESATEESHTRNLLYGQSHHTYSLAQSPPVSPYATPVFRPGSFDDRGGLELEEKDIRILIAQDVSGLEDKPTLLFDSRSSPAANTTSSSHVRHASMTGPRSPLPVDWQSQVQHAASIPSDSPFRNRSSTTTGPTPPWSRQVKDVGTREEAFLECMFGVMSSAKTTSTTKLHILPGRPKITTKSEFRVKTGIDNHDQSSRRVPLNRSRTSNTIVKSPHHPTLPDLDTESHVQDSILITRLFSIALSEAVAPTPRPSDVPSSPMTDAVSSEPGAPTTVAAPAQPPKKPKLVERKVPAFAIGLVINLPRLSDSQALTQSRPISRATHAHTLSSASSSYGSDMQSSWTFLNAIPESLGSTASTIEDPDRRIETIVGNEDVILRAIAMLEVESSRVIQDQLQKILDHVTGPGPKSPKEKSMQRINQRIISISDATAVSRVLSLQQAAKHAIRRVLYALRIPRVTVGLGFGAGHWSDEARTAFRVCGRRQQNFFLFTLLTVFLGNHTQWLQRLAPDWYRKQHRNYTKMHGELHSLCQRTIIVSGQRAIARRLIFLLASFLPGVQGLDGLQKPAEDLSVAQFSMSSPSSHLVRNESLRRTANRRMREHRLHSSHTDKGILSTSIDSTDSILTAENPHRFLARKHSDAVSIKGPALLSMPEGDSSRKISGARTSTLPTNPATPVAVFSTKQGGETDSYFPPFADNRESIATTGLVNILRRSSSSLGNSSTVSSRWGSLVSGFSEIWGNRQYSSGDSGSMTAYSSTGGSTERRRTEQGTRRDKINTLQDMVQQLDRDNAIKSSESRTADQPRKSLDNISSPSKQVMTAPRLRVDDKDGVIDVDLDLPGFTRFDTDDLFRSPTKSTGKSFATSIREGAESVRSLRSIPAASHVTMTPLETNVAGYLKRHHEDFSLHAVRPYAELEEDVKRSMLAEPSPSRESVCSGMDDAWTPICSTVIADVRTFSIRRLTLKRKLEVSDRAQSSDGTRSTSESLPLKKNHKVDVQQTFIDEEIKDFDAVLADAIEKVLDLGDAIQMPAVPSLHQGHGRTTSSGTMKSTSPSTPAGGSASYTAIPREYVKQDCRQVVLGALEEIVKDVCNDLSKLERGRDIHGSRNFDSSAVKEEMKQENVLREGVKCWLLNLEQAKVY